MVIFFGWIEPFSQVSMSGNSRSLCLSWLVTVASGLRAYFGMAGCLVSAMLASETLGLLL